MVKVLRLTTVPISLKILTKGQLLHLYENGFEIHAASSQGKEIDDLYEQEKIKKHYSISLSRRITPFKDLKAIWQCYILIKRIKPDIVHTYTPKAGMVGMIASFLARSKIRLHNVTGLPLMEQHGIRYKILVLVEKLTYLCATNVYVNSKGLLEYIQKNIISHQKIKILGNGSTNGIDGDFFKRTAQFEIECSNLKRSLGINNDSFIWVFVGRLVGDKGIHELVKAFEQCLTKATNSKLLLVGNFEDDLDPIQTSTKEKILTNENIIFVGFQSDVRHYLGLSNCLVFPSYREGLPNVPLQAACLNLPIIATDINGCNEIVEDGVNGLLVKPKNSEDLYLKMIKIFEDEGLRESFKSCTRDIILKRFDKHLVWNNILREYNNLLK